MFATIIYIYIGPPTDFTRTFDPRHALIAGIADCEFVDRKLASKLQKHAIYLTNDLLIECMHLACMNDTAMSYEATSMPNAG
jgi:hypothetical protein